MASMGEHDEKVKGSGISRRGFAVGCAGAAVMLGLGGVKYLPSQALCRPVGGQDEGQLVSACIHCERCREACPKTAIAPAHIEAGILNARTPRMDFKAGWCDFCENEPGGPRCIAVCPTAALKAENPGPHTVVIGVAKLTRDWCLAARGMGCHSCVDACPYEALSLGYDHVPVIDESKCNGCGACEFACISLTAGSLSGTLSVPPTDRAITVQPLEA